MILKDCVVQKIHFDRNDTDGAVKSTACSIVHSQASVGYYQSPNINAGQLSPIRLTPPKFTYKMTIKKYCFTFLFLSIFSLFSAFAQAPTITSFLPVNGAIGTIINVKGTNLLNASNLTIGGVSSIIISKTDTTIVGMLMPNAVTGLISATTPGGTANSSSNFIITATAFPTRQQGNKLVGTGAVGAASQGERTAISADGNTIAVSGHLDNSDRGAVWVFVRNGGIWSQQGSKLVGTDATGVTLEQGSSVAISADGNTIVFGGRSDNFTRGATWVFTRSNGTWTQQGSKLVGANAIGFTSQGGSCSLSADGNTLIIGGSNDDGRKGAAWIFTRNNGVWTQQGNKLVGSGASGNAAQGSNVSMSADGNTVAIAGEADNGNLGATWVFTRTGGVWTQVGSKLVGTGSVGNAAQGFSTSLNANGTTLAIGGTADNGTAGAVWIFTFNGTNWIQQGNKLVGTGAVGNASQGWAVSLSADGNTLLSSGYYDNTAAGATWMFTRSAGVWSQQGNKIVGTGASGIATQGYSAAITANANTFIHGGAFDNNNIGAAWVFSTNIADLDGLGMSGGVLSPSFAPGTTSYTTTVSNNTTSVTITPTRSESTATITVNGSPVPSGSASGNIALAVGNNTITTIVTAGDGHTTKIYTIVVNRLPSSNANLSNLNLSNGALSPAFAPDTTAYTASVANAISSVTVSPTIAEANAIIHVRVNGGSYTGVTSGNASGSLGLNTGNNTIEVRVTAQDGTQKTYTILITRGLALDLASLTANSEAAGAYSLRRLSTTYTGNVIQVRRSSDNDSLNIGFNGNGLLDTVALKAFVGSGDGFVRIWYDQSGRGNNAVQTTLASQPRIVTAGVVERKNNIISLLFSASQTLAIAQTTGTMGLQGANFEMNAVVTPSTTSPLFVIGSSQVAENYEMHTFINSNRFILDSLIYADAANGANFNGSITSIVGGRYNGTQAISRKDGIDGTGITAPTNNENHVLQIGARAGPQFQFNGTMYEILLFPANINSDRTSLETNQGAFYAPLSLSPVSIQSNNSNTALASSGSVITLSFTASKPLLTPTVTIAGIAASVTNPSGNNWQATVTVTNATPLGGATFTIAYSDLYGNIATATSTTNSSSVTIRNRLDLAGLSSNSVAASAYSLRKLSSTYTGSAIQVRRSSDNDSLNIGFLSNGLLDTATLKTFVGAGNGFIRVWYDQSGRGNNAIQTTQSSQPRIISSGVVERRNNRPSILYSGAQFFEIGNSTTALGITGRNYELISTIAPLNAAINFIVGSDSIGRYEIHTSNNVNRFIYSDLAIADVANGSNYNGNIVSIVGGRYTGTHAISRKDGADGTSVLGAINNTVANLLIGIRQAGAFPLSGYINELFVFPDNISSDRNLIRKPI